MRHEYFEINHDAEMLVVRLHDPRQAKQLLDSEFACELTQLAREQRPQWLLVDLEQVTVCTSELVEGLLRLRRTVASYGGNLRVCHVHGQTAEVFRILRVAESGLEVASSWRDAREEFAAQQALAV